jgi:hypothetical protein
MALTLVTAPDLEPITLTEAKDHLRVDDANSDALISELVAAARRTAEKWLRRALITQTWRLTLDTFPVENRMGWWDGVREGAVIDLPKTAVEIPLPPLQSVTSVTTYAQDDASSVFSSANYRVDTANEPGRIVVKADQSWPTGLRNANAVEIVFVAGFGDNATDVPEPIRAGILMLVAHLFENREAASPERVTEVPLGVDAIWAPYRIVAI